MTSPLPLSTPSQPLLSPYPFLSDAFQFPQLAPAPAPAPSLASTSRPEIDIDDILRGLAEAGGLLDLSERLLRDIQVEKEGKKLEALHQQYVQTIQALIPLSTTNLFGGLPVPLSTTITQTELVEWVEARASLEFTRKEAVRAASRSVLDILKGS
ncbi:hypothetical protein P7C73_g1315, partial [Tremellales sp. Uapishka_1]